MLDDLENIQPTFEQKRICQRLRYIIKAKGLEQEKLPLTRKVPTNQEFKWTY